MSGQAYDGAANMQGELKYLATRFAKENPSSLQVLCLTHCLNLCVQDVARQCSSVRDALDLVQEILHLFKLSPKRDALFKTNRDNRQPGYENIRPLYSTRWTVKGASIELILKTTSFCWNQWKISALPPLMNIPVELEVRCQTKKCSRLFGAKIVLDDL